MDRHGGRHDIVLDAGCRCNPPHEIISKGGTVLVADPTVARQRLRRNRLATWPGCHGHDPLFSQSDRYLRPDRFIYELTRTVPSNPAADKVGQDRLDHASERVTADINTTSVRPAVRRR